MTRPYVVGIVLLLVACGGDSTGPSKPFPSVAGTYQLDGTFDDFAPSVASFTGTLTITQASRDDGALGGSISLTANLGGSVLTISNRPLQEASVSPAGNVAFQAQSATPGTTWTFSGLVSGGNVANGRHTLTDGVDAFSGAWTASKSGATVVAVSPQDAGDDTPNVLHTLSRMVLASQMAAPVR